MMALAVVSIFCATAHAMMLKIESFAVYGISFELPDGWKLTTDDSGKVLITSPDDSSSIMFVYAHREGWDAHRFAIFIATDAGLEVETISPAENEEGYFEFTVEETNYRTWHVINMGIVMKTGNDKFDDLQSILNTLVYPL